MLGVLIGIIVVAILIYVGIVLYQRYLLKQITDLQNKKSDLMDLPVASELDEVGNLNLAGSSLEEYQNLQDDYRNVKNNKFPEIDELAETGQQNVNDMKIFDARSDVSGIKDAVQVIQSESDRIQAALDQIKQESEDQQNEVKVLRHKYQDLRKTLLAKNMTYGPSIDMLNDSLERLENAFENFAKTVESGDHKKAEGQLQQLQTSTKGLEEQLEAIPELYIQLNEDFPGQLDEIKNGYTQLINHNYAFADDEIPNDIEDIGSKINENLDTLSNLRLDAVKGNNETIANRIDNLYDLMQTEIDARTDVDGGFQTIAEYIEHAEKQSHTLLIEIDRLGQSYVLNGNEDSQAHDLEAKLQDIRSEHDQDAEAITNQPVVYSEILQRMHEENDQLDDIESQQTAINESIQKLIEEEKDSRRTLHQFDLEIHEIKRHIENLNLPGIPASYMDYFFVVSDEIEKLSSNMNQVKIDMKQIDQQLGMIDKDMQSLAKKTTELTDNAALSEEIIQYTNRYRHSNETVDNASKRAQKLFDEDHDYAQSLSVISRALESVEPGMVDQLTESYQKQKSTQY
ncbi:MULTISPECIES: septation ring formation regulator EzrA [Pediococcus]|mgnify:CR=1 FL=1|uniref:septation ring formation regulator EzrA n=1 Tax=Pediococcus TaxID=1253 RepID=UPI000E9A88F0|nr:MULTISPECIES: septation ring formation regulator EzrA [Pediococcus]MCT3029695.1 septation ring formation regulator EzrA [Pediococcus parvulus]MCT3030505.1 septation ring formation regulator EzrA [Pediococcus parvulus]MCT3035603.1 septation ring formation regulator EzrA [Pediococcus parvulus]MDN5574693.1 septation ring formation regulator EzrA [Pediococcus sp.]HBO48138.1 septation ring formation regulator EzrA [Pediococcus sp.]